MTSQEILHRLGIQPLTLGACWGPWVENPSGGELVWSGDRPLAPGLYFER